MPLGAHARRPFCSATRRLASVTVFTGASASHLQPDMTLAVWARNNSRTSHHKASLPAGMRQANSHPRGAEHSREITSRRDQAARR
jgi:hypothetical protein